MENKSRLQELCGSGWTLVEPPLNKDSENIIARHMGTPIRSGFLIERIEDSGDVFHVRYRTGRFDVELKVDYTVGRGMLNVTTAPGYESSNSAECQE